MTNDTKRDLNASSFDHTLLLNYGEVAKALGIKSRILRSDILEIAVQRAMNNDNRHKVVFNGYECAFADLIKIADAHLTPAAIKLLLSLLAADALPLRNQKSVIPKQILDFANQDEETLFQNSEKVRENRRAEKAARDKAFDQKIINLDQIREDEFTWSLLNSVFFKHLGKGSGTLTIGGLKVTKINTQYFSNSGKTNDWKTSFSWRRADGSPQELVRDSSFEGNRRNDSKRNFGLPD